MFFEAVEFSVVMLYGTPVLSLLLFLVALIAYCYAKRRNKVVPGTYTAAQIKRRKIAMLVTGVIAGIFLILILALIVLLMTAVAFM